MTESNIGGRKKRMAKDHLFILYGLINDVVNGNGNDLEVTTLDIEKAFDKLNLKYTLNDMVDKLPDEHENDKIALLFKANETTKFAVKTPFGLTERVEKNEVVQQGGSWGGILCSNTVDKTTETSVEEEEELYKYKNELPIPDLSYVYDRIGISECGLPTLERNVKVTSRIEMNRLKFNVGKAEEKSKCLKMHVSRNKNHKKECLDLIVRGKPMESVNEITFLGDIVSSCGKNINNIRERVSKGIGIINQIFVILDSICFGKQFFEMALLLRSSMLLNSILYNSCVCTVFPLPT